MRRFFALAALLLLACAGCADALSSQHHVAPPRLPSEAIPADILRPAAISASIHPVVAAMPASVETSIEAVARYIAEREPDRRLRIKALHDWVADRIAYDVVAYRRFADALEAARGHDAVFANPDLAEVRALEPRAHLLTAPCTAVPSLCAQRYDPRFPDPASAFVTMESSTDVAQRAFDRRVATCAGYAALLHALGEAIGEDIAVVVGQASASGASVFGGPLHRHAWNVAQTGHGYEAIDVTWDAGRVEGTRFIKRYGTTWLFPKSAQFVATHIPAGSLERGGGTRVCVGDAGDELWKRDSRFALAGGVARTCD